MRVSRFSVVQADDGLGGEITGGESPRLGWRQEPTCRVEVEMRMTADEVRRFVELVRRDWGVSVPGAPAPQPHAEVSVPGHLTSTASRRRLGP